MLRYLVHSLSKYLNLSLSLMFFLLSDCAYALNVTNQPIIGPFSLPTYCVYKIAADLQILFCSTNVKCTLSSWVSMLTIISDAYAFNLNPQLSLSLSLYFLTFLSVSLFSSLSLILVPHFGTLFFV